MLPRWPLQWNSFWWVIHAAGRSLHAETVIISQETPKWQSCIWVSRALMSNPSELIYSPSCTQNPSFRLLTLSLSEVSKCLHFLSKSRRTLALFLLWMDLKRAPQRPCGITERWREFQEMVSTHWNSSCHLQVPGGGQLCSTMPSATTFCLATGSKPTNQPTMCQNPWSHEWK